MLQVVSYYTRGNGYEAEARAMVESANAVGLKPYVQQVPNLGSWQANTQHKAEFIEHCLDKYPSFLYVDADARFRSYPWLCDNIVADVAFHRRDGRELLSGTLFFNRSANSYQVVTWWQIMNERNRGEFDQRNLDRALHEVQGLNVYELPAAYCQIFDTMAHHGSPVIEHMQASRRLRS